MGLCMSKPRYEDCLFVLSLAAPRNLPNAITIYNRLGSVYKNITRIVLCCYYCCPKGKNMEVNYSRNTRAPTTLEKNADKFDLICSLHLIAESVFKCYTNFCTTRHP